MGCYDLSARARRLLATLVREYIETGEPVSSQVLAHESGLGVSSATVRSVLQRIEFIPLAGPRALVVVVSRGNQVTQKVIDTGEELRQDELVQAANYLNTEFAGLPLDQVRDAVLERLHQERTLYDRLLARALRLASSTLEQMPK